MLFKDQTAIINKAVKLLTRREHSRSELRSKLLRYGFSSTAVDTAIAELANQNIQNDERFLENFVEAHISRGQGPLKIAAQLRSHGITREKILTILDEHAALWQESAIQVRERRFGTALPVDSKNRIAQGRFLAQRGFTTKQIRSALSICSPTDVNSESF